MPPSNDPAITEGVQDRLNSDRATQGALIGANVVEGVVTLTGTVDSLLIQERAARVAETVNGVRAVVDRIVVDTGPPPRDDVLRNEVVEALTADPVIDARKLGVFAQDGVVSLTGTVGSNEVRKSALRAARSVRGVKRVDDQIAIAYHSQRSDDQIVRDVVDALKWNTYLSGMPIGVRVWQGNVMLSGRVGSLAEKRLAESIAWVNGVKMLNSDGLTVDQRMSNPELRESRQVFKPQEIRDAVNAALLQDPRVASFGISVDVQGTTVTLSGTVDNLKAMRAAEQDARNTTGVEAVENRLEIRPTVHPSDGEIAEAVERMFRRDSVLEPRRISVGVLNGTVHLYGLVDTYYEKWRADELASQILGVVGVDNGLAVRFGAYRPYDPYLDEWYVPREDVVDY